MSLYLAHFRHAVNYVREHSISKTRVTLDCAIIHVRLAINQPGISRESKSRAFRVLNWLRADLRKLLARERVAI